ncbi:MAG: DUF4303 domain-containing protein [Propionibacteriaceae bacterium]|nr:DUF4303 domain-containing protein [Propionibacteriaceae bacterium]
MDDATLIQHWLDRLDPHLDELRAAILDALPRLTGERDDIVAVGLFSDDSADTIVAAALTAAHQQANDEEYPHLADYLPWVTDEWDLIASQPDALSALAEKIAPLAEDVPAEQFVLYRATKFVWIVDAMAGLVKDGWFEEHYPGANVTFWVTDSDIDEETVIEWVEDLNPPERAARFVAFARSHGI